MARLTETMKGRFLQELLLDPDWTLAGKRAGLSKKQAENLMQNEKFMKLAEKQVEKALVGVMDAGGAVERFRKTQVKLEAALDAGDLSVASNLIKTHDMEFRMQGLFERDNNQKSAPMQININLGEAPMQVIEGDVDE